jgi:hypothetical protein
MDMEIDKAWKNQSARGIDLHSPHRSFEMRPHSDNSARIDQHVGDTTEPSRIDHVPACNVNNHDSVCS